MPTGSALVKGKQRSFITDRLKADRRALEKKRKAEARGRKHLREILDSLIAPPASCQLPPPTCAAQARTLRAARLKEEPPHPSRWQTSPGPHHGIIVHVLLENEKEITEESNIRQCLQNPVGPL